MNETEDQRIVRLKSESEELRELADDLGSPPSPRSIDLRKHADEKHEEATQLMERQLEDAETLKASDAPCALLGEDSVMRSAEARVGVAREDGRYRGKGQAMTLDEAKTLLGNSIQADGSIRQDHPPFRLRFIKGKGTAELDGSFVPDELEAIALYMRSVAAVTK